MHSIVFFIRASVIFGLFLLSLIFIAKAGFSFFSASISMLSSLAVYILVSWATSFLIEKECPACKSSIHYKAIKCPKCLSDQ